MSTTSIRIEDIQKQRITAMADRAGKTAHAFIVDAIAETVEQAERKAEAHRIADERWGKALATGKTVPWSEAKAYLVERARSTAAGKPVVRKLRNPGSA